MLEHGLPKTVSEGKEYDKVGFIQKVNPKDL